ncbi:MAG: methyltransferase domain-containing protein [candidate division NC10 bacterium]
MGWLTPLPRAAGVLEMLDRPAPFADLRLSLEDVVRLNAVFGGRRVTLAHVKRLLARLPAAAPVTVLDLGTGAADIPLALIRWARRARRSLRVFALDRDWSTLRVARGLTMLYPEITFVQADALALPFRRDAVDVVISALTLHHLEPAGAARCLEGMDAVSRIGLVVNDLYRSRAAWALVWVATRLLARSRMSWHDGPLSVLRAYTAEELRGLCARARLGPVEIWRYPPLLRHCLVKAKTA